jgi:excisionase family DNA binding protein
VHSRAHNGTTIEPLLKVNDVCAALAVGRSTLYRLVREHQLVPTFVGSRARFEVDEIRDYIRRNRATGSRQ